MKAVAGILAAASAYKFTSSILLSLWALFFPFLTHYFEQQLDKLIMKLAPWKINLKPVLLFLIAIVCPVLFSLMISLLLNLANLGGLAAAFTILLVPPFAYMAARRPVSGKKEVEQ